MGERIFYGSSVVVIGCGGIGLSAVQGARIVGATPIIAVDLVASKLGHRFPKSRSPASDCEMEHSDRTMTGKVAIITDAGVARPPFLENLRVLKAGAGLS